MTMLHSCIRALGGGGAGQLLTSLILNYGMDYSKSSIMGIKFGIPDRRSCHFIAA